MSESQIVVELPQTDVRPAPATHQKVRRPPQLLTEEVVEHDWQCGFSFTLPCED